MFSDLIIVYFFYPMFFVTATINVCHHIRQLHLITERFTARKSFNERIKNEHERDSILNRGELYHSKREKEMEKKLKTFENKIFNVWIAWQIESYKQIASSK